MTQRLAVTIFLFLIKTGIGGEGARLAGRRGIAPSPGGRVGAPRPQAWDADRGAAAPAEGEPAMPARAACRPWYPLSLKCQQLCNRSPLVPLLRQLNVTSRFLAVPLLRYLTISDDLAGTVAA